MKNIYLKDWYNSFYPISDSDLERDLTNRVYLLYAEESKLCKIGISRNIENRIQQITTASGLTIHHLLSIETERLYDESANFIEKKLHEFYKDKRIRGEWFNLDLRDIIQIRDLFHNVICGSYLDDTIKESINIIKHGSNPIRYKFCKSEIF
jgi:hypothetical protein